MKKKLEAELISIAHRILKLKNRADLDQLQEETLKLYEKLSVLKFVEDHFGGAEPTIGRASAVFNLEEIYGLEEVAPVHGNEVEAQEDKARAEKKSTPAPKGEEEANDIKQDKENKGGEGVGTDGDGKAPVSAEEESEVAEEDTSPKGEQEEPESPPTPEGGEKEPEAIEEAETAVEEEKEEDKEEVEKPAEEEKPEVKEEEPAVKVVVEKPAEDIKAEEAAAASVFEKEAESTIEEEEKAADAEIKTITPDANTKTEPAQAGFEFAFERAEEPKKPKEVSFEDFHDYKEPEFIKKDSPLTPKGGEAPSPKAEEPAPADDWRNWEPKKSPLTPEGGKEAEAPAPEAPKPAEPVRDWRDWEPSTQAPKGGETLAEPAKPVEAAKPADTPKPANTVLGRSIALGLNDRIAFEKNLFGGSADDLNRVISQLNTLNNFDEARNFIDDLVKPDYANWAGKEEYEERFMALVEKRFS